MDLKVPINMHQLIVGLWIRGVPSPSVFIFPTQWLKCKSLSAGEMGECVWPGRIRTRRRFYNLLPAAQCSRVICHLVLAASNMHDDGAPEYLLLGRQCEDL